MTKAWRVQVSEQSERRRPGASKAVLGGLLAAGVFSAGLLPLPVAAQVTIGGPAQPSVEVNLDAIYGGGSRGPATAGPGSRDYDPLEPAPRRRLLIPNLHSPDTGSLIGQKAPQLTPPAGFAAAPSGAPAPVLRPPADRLVPQGPADSDTGTSMAARSPVMPAPSPPPLRAEKPTRPAPRQPESMPAAPAPSAAVARGQLPAGMVPPPPKPMTAQPMRPQATPALPPAPVAVPVPVPSVVAAAPPMTKPEPPAPTVAVPPPAPLPIEQSAPKAMSETPLADRRVASLPPADSGTLQIPFGAGSAAISTADEGRLKAFASGLQDNDKRVQLRAFAAEEGDSASKARRLSLSRALSVRSYLIENGVRSTRIDVRAIGASGDGGPADRVDIIVIER